MENKHRTDRCHICSEKIYRAHFCRNEDRNEKRGIDRLTPPLDEWNDGPERDKQSKKITTFGETSGI